MVKMTWKKTQSERGWSQSTDRELFGMYAFHIPKCRRVLRQTLQQPGLHAARGGDRAAGFLKEAMVCAFRHEVRRVLPDHRLGRLSG